MSEEELKQMIEGGESWRMEFKESLQLKDEIGGTVSAFANTGGGVILVGVDDSGKIIGAEMGKRTIEGLANFIKQNTDNHLYPKITVGNVGRKAVIIIEASEADEKPVFFRGKAYKRVGRSNHKLSASEIRKLAKESGKKVYWDESVCGGADLKDIDEEKVKWFLKKAKTERNFDVEPETPIKEALGRLGLMKNGKLTNASVLLFGIKPQKFFLQAETRCARFKGIKPVKPFIDMKVFGGNIIDQADKSLNFVLEHTPMEVYLAGKPEREERYEYPPDAIREGIINAICHRDYGVSGNVQLRMFDDRIEIWGCGPLPEPLTVEDIKRKHRSILRNPLIGKCLFLIRFIEQWGTGTNDMIQDSLNWGLPEPLFEEVAGSLIVTFRKSKLTDEYLDSIGLNTRQKNAINYLKEHGRIGRKTYCGIGRVEKTVAHEELSDMVDKELIEMRSKGRGVYYILKIKRTISGR